MAYPSMLDRVVVDVVDVAAQIHFVSNNLFPLAALPYSAFALLYATLLQALGWLNGAGESGFNETPSRRIVGVHSRQGPDTMEVVG